MDERIRLYSPQERAALLDALTLYEKVLEMEIQRMREAGERHTQDLPVWP
jgi:hypothetical protein